MLLTSRMVSYVSGPVVSGASNPGTGILFHPTNTAVEVHASATPQMFNERLVLVIYVVLQPG